jgi:hypothetical protein
MIRRQLVQWILLPNGLTPDGMLAASVYVAPRLRCDAPATLADFPDFADWPAQVSEDLLIERDDGATSRPRSISVLATRGLWPALLPPTTPVRAFAFGDFADRPLVSYPVGEVLGHLRERWARLAHEARDELPVTNRNAAPIGPPPAGGELPAFTLAEHFEELRAATNRGIFEGVDDGEQLSARLRDQIDAAAAQARAQRQRHDPSPQPLIRPFGAGGSPQEAAYALACFHARPVREQPKPFPADREQARAELAQQLDFHHHLSALGSHPALLRRLGLVIDLVLDPGFVPSTADGDAPTRLRLRLARDSAFPPRAADPAAATWNADVTPWTMCRLTEVEGAAFFSAVERSARLDFAHGFLRMDPASWTQVAVDVDGLALKGLSMAATLQRQEVQEQRPVEEPERDGVPAARSGGVALVRSERAQVLHEDFEQARRNDDALEQDPDDPPALAAEDLVRGYRVDVCENGTWRSLHHRRVRYDPARDPAEAIEVEDEGSVELSLAAEADRPGAPADPDRPLYAHEALVTWDGWGLSAPRPGRAVAQEPAVPPAGTDLDGMQLGIAVAALPGSLPRLRFEGRYRMRARTVDLAGNAHSPADSELLGGHLESTGQARYLTTAPAVAAEPLRYLRCEPLPAPELVPRLPFGPGESLERLVIAAGRPLCDRHVAAAKASLALVEAHGLLDEAIDAVRGLDPAAATAAVQLHHEVAARESGSFRDTPGALFVSTGTHDGQDEGYVCIDADAVELPYLPDPLGAGVLVRLELGPGRPPERLEIPFSDDGRGWHRALPLRLRLEEGDATIVYDEARRLLTVGVPAGRTARLRISSLLGGDPEAFAILDWCRQELDAASAERVHDAIRAGTHWMTTPWRDLVLVHAVQRPLEPAELDLELDELPSFPGRPTKVRARDATAVELAGVLFCDPPSTAQLDLSASWEELRDDPEQAYDSAGEMAHSVRRNVFSLAVPEPFGTPWLPEISPLIEPVDERAVAFRTVGGDWDVERLRAHLLEGAAAPGLPARERRRLEAGAAQLEHLRAHELGDTRYRRVTYQATAASRFREYFDPATPVADGIAAGAPVTVELLSSAPPAKPQVLQVLPLMRRDASSGADGARTSKHSGLGLRVWLQRPWWSSGAGELLAVVCETGPVSPESELSRLITLRVQDPAHASTVPQPLTANSFRNAELVQRSVPLHGGDGQRRDVAAYRPQWDRMRQAWYCDVEFPAGTEYFPFIRLGLARYQSMSIPGCELSPIVATAFVQTVPDRTLTCAVAPDGDSARVALAGPAPSASASADGEDLVVAGTNLVVAVAETQDPAFADPLLGWSAAGPEQELTAVLHGDGTATWSATVPLPGGGNRKRRLTVREYELHPANAPPSPALVPTRRLVHADTVPL